LVAAVPAWRPTREQRPSGTTAAVAVVVAVAATEEAAGWQT